MSEFTILGTTTTEGVDELSKNIVNIFAENYEKSVDEMFGRLHGHLSVNEKNDKYNKNDYKRVAFKNEKQVKRFMETMRKQGVAAVAAPTKLNGQYLAEIPAQITASLLDNEDLTRGIDPNDKISAAAILENYQDITLEIIENPNDSLKYDDRRETVKSDPRIQLLFTRHLDELGSVINRADGLVNRLSQYGTNNNDNIFKNKPHKRTGEANLSVNSRKSLKATVYNNDTVIINGKVVDGEIRENILRQHQMRSQKANEILSGNQKHFRKVSNLAKSNAEAIKNSIYRQEYVVSGAKNIKRVSYGGELDKFAEMLNTEAAIFSVSSELLLSDKDKSLLKDIKTIPSVSLIESELIDKVTEQASANINLTVNERQSLVSLVSKKKIELKKELSNDLRNLTSVERKFTQISSSPVFITAAEMESLRRFETLDIKADEKTALTFLSNNTNANRTGYEFSGSVQEKEDLGRLFKNYGDSLKNTRTTHYEIAASEYTDVRSLINLTDDERKMFSSDAANLLNGIENDFGIKITQDNPLTRENLLEINAAFIKRAEKEGFQFVKANGKFDIEMLQGLNSKQLDKLGISESTRDMLVKINSPDAFGKKMSLSGAKSLLLEFTTKANDEDSEFQQTVSDFYSIGSGVSYAKKSVVAIRRFGRLHISDTRKAKNVGFDSQKSFEGINTPNVEKKSPKIEKSTPVDTDRNKKYIEKQQKKLEKTAKSEKSIVAKGKNAANKIGKKASESAIGKLVTGAKAVVSDAVSTVLPYVLVGVVGIAFQTVLFMVIIGSVASLLDYSDKMSNKIDNLLAPDTYSDTIAYALYDFMKDEENAWLDDIDNFRNIYDNRDKIRYGFNYESLEDYINSTSSQRKGQNIMTDGNDIYINPFWQSEAYGAAFEIGGTNSDILTKADDFDGKNDVDISANTNAYNKRSESSSIYDDGAYLGYSSIENGHTSNIKDIIAMIDVMYMDGSSDSELEGIIAKAPAQVNWADFRNKVNSIYKWVGSIASSFFNGEEPPTFNALKDSMGNTVSYKTVQNYALNLFEASHQQEITLKTEYYTVDEEYGGSQEKASEHDICVSPVEKDFKLMWNTNHVSPFFYGSTGGKHPVDTNDFDVRIDMTNIVDADEACIWNTMSNDEETWNSVKELSEEGICWTSELTQEEFSESFLSDNTTADFEEYSEEILFSEARQKAYDAMNNFLNSHGTTIEISEDRNTITKVWYTPKEHTDDTNVQYLKDGYLYYLEDGLFEDGDYSDYIGMVSYGDSYKAKVKYAVVKHTEVLTRDCQGHGFKYCGGHICVHSQGVVFSVTNEQIDMAGIMEDNEPVAMDFDLAEHGYDNIRGKYISNEIDKSTVLTASQSGGCKSPLYDIQGSYIGTQGVNFYIDGEQWGEGFHLTGMDNFHLMRDIFDVDCMIKKGNNTLPIRTSDWKSYEGWTDENMTLAIMRMSMDWHELYGFDIPLEIGDKIGEGTAGFTLAQDDIDNIVEALKNKYGAGFTSEREEAVRLTLAWVGRGHYSDLHKEHGFLSEACKGLTVDVRWEDGSTGTVNYDGCCTAGNDVGFINFIYKKMGKIGGTTETISSANSGFASDYSDCKPMDVIIHEANHTDDFSDLEADVWKDFKGYNSVIYIGTLNEDLTLTTGQVLHANVPIIVDLNKINNIGNIYIHGAEPSDVNDFSGDATYWWVTNPDAFTKVRRFD